MEWILCFNPKIISAHITELHAVVTCVDAYNSKIILIDYKIQCIWFIIIYYIFGIFCNVNTIYYIAYIKVIIFKEKTKYDTDKKSI